MIEFYPTLKAIQAKLQEVNNLPVFKISTLRKILNFLGFTFSRHSKSKDSLLTDRESLVAWRKKYLQALLEARRSGTPVFYLDESYCHQYHCKQKTWRDTIVCSKQDTVGRGLTTGIKTPASMRGKRIIILHCGNEGGFLPDVGRVFVPCKTNN